MLICLCIYEYIYIHIDVFESTVIIHWSINHVMIPPQIIQHLHKPCCFTTKLWYTQKYKYKTYGWLFQFPRIVFKPISMMIFTPTSVLWCDVLHQALVPFRKLRQIFGINRAQLLGRRLRILGLVVFLHTLFLGLLQHWAEHGWSRAPGEPSRVIRILIPKDLWIHWFCFTDPDFFFNVPEPVEYIENMLTSSNGAILFLDHPKQIAPHYGRYHVFNALTPVECIENFLGSLM